MGKLKAFFKNWNWYHYVLAFLALVFGTRILLSLHDVGTDPPPTPIESASLAEPGLPDPCIEINEGANSNYSETFYVKVPCDRVPNIEEQSGGNIEYSGDGGGSVTIDLLVFENEAQRPITSSEVRVNGAPRSNPLIIEENDYLYDPGRSPDTCYARVQVNVTFQASASPTNNYNFVFSIRDHGRVLHRPNVFDLLPGQSIRARCRSDNDDNTLGYYRCLDNSINHIRHHVHIVNMTVCEPDVE